jgi:DNA-binding NtrC family response regulator
MSGGELAKELETLRPETRVLFVSGYAGQTVVDHNVVDVETNFLQKPFTLKQLVSSIRGVLDDGGNVAHVVTEAVENARTAISTSASASHL